MNSTFSRRGAGLNLIQDMATAWRLLWDPRVPGLLKVGLPLLAMIYWVSPIDLLPGLPFDDIALLIVALKMFVNMAPQDAQSNAAGHAEAGFSHRQDEGDVVDTTWQVIDD
jgi:uncharacterized membrane protein YkvA (DUF1232 family)